MTKEELEQKIRQLESQIEDLQAQLAEKDAMLGARPKGAGYLVTTPSANYSGMTAGVQFRNGQAFLPLDDPQAEKLAMVLKNDFYYSLELVGGDNGKG
jgi:hypothetical protein